MIQLPLIYLLLIYQILLLFFSVSASQRPDPPTLLRARWLQASDRNIVLQERHEIEKKKFILSGKNISDEIVGLEQVDLNPGLLVMWGKPRSSHKLNSNTTTADFYSLEYKTIGSWVLMGNPIWPPHTEYYFRLAG